MPYEGAPWSEADDRDLRAALAAGKKRPRQIAKLLMRTEGEVRERLGYPGARRLRTVRALR